MLISDVKGELWETTRKYREEIFGHRCVKIDPKDPQNSCHINPLDPIAHHLAQNNPAALTWAKGMAEQLHPDPKGGNNQNQFFYNGARDIISTLFLAVSICLPPERRTMDVAYRAIFDLDLFHDLMDTARNETVLNGELASRANALHDMAFSDNGNERTFEQYRSGTLQALEAFGPGNYLAGITQKSTISFKDLKSEDLSIYLTIDFANTEVLGKFAGLMQWMACQELVEVGNNKPVLFVLDEFCNAPVHTLPKILTLLRTYGVRLIMATQDHDDITRVYDKHALETVLSETDIKQYLGGIRSKNTLEYLSRMMGEYTEVAANASLDPELVRHSVSKTQRALMTADELRRLPDGGQIILYGNKPPILAKKVQVFAIAPWRKQITPNSLYGGKRKLLPVEVNIGFFGTRVTRLGARLAKRIQRQVQARTPSALKRAGRLILGRLLQAPAAVLLIVFGIWVYAFGAPNLMINHPGTYARTSPAPIGACFYVGPTAWGWQHMGSNCPHVLWKKTW